MKHKHGTRRVTAAYRSILAALGVAASLCACQAGEAPSVDTAESGSLPEETETQDVFPLLLMEGVPDYDWQKTASFPDAYDYVDNTLALNSTLSFLAYEGAGEIYLQTDSRIESFQLFVNGVEAATAKMTGGFVFCLDISSATKNGINTLQVSAVTPHDIEDAVRVYIPYPVITEGEAKASGIREETLSLIDMLVETDVAHGFPSAQIAVIRNGRLVFEKAWGTTCVTHPLADEGAVSVPVTTDTLYDLASVTKMFGVNFTLQKLVTDGLVDLDAPLSSYLGESFYDHTEPRAGTDAAAMRAWKERLTPRDLLQHSAGFPEDPRSYNFYYDTILGAHDRQTLKEALYRVPLVYEPGTQTRYSDMDYMLLGLMIEEVTGKDLDSCLKEYFCTPLGLSHITYTPLEHGFTREQIAATALTGNTLDGRVNRAGLRTHTLQGEVHDENAWHGFAGVAGHAGLYANARDLAKLASVMLTGGYGEHRFFSKDVISAFTAAKSEKDASWGLGWWREADDARVWYFGTQSSPDAFGHQGWTGTIVIVDPARNLVIACLTNKINSPVIQDRESSYLFEGSCFTSASLGFVPQILSIGMDGTGEEDVDAQLISLLVSMTDDAFRMIPENASEERRAPLEQNAAAKLALCQQWAEKSGREDFVRQAEVLRGRYAAGRTDTARESDAGEILCGDMRYEEYLPQLQGKRVALYANHTAKVQDAASGAEMHLLDALLARDVQVTAVFAPEHGFRGEAVAGQAVDSYTDEATGIPVISLYGASQRAPTEEEMAAFDVLLVDIQDVGCRFYTYYITMMRLMEACAAYQKTMIVLDRPNPNGYYTDGPLLREGFYSGVGALPIPVVHGMTLGELARMIQGEGWITGAEKLDLKVVPCENYTHESPVQVTTAPSPALGDTRAVLLYPSLCFFENSTVSVGRGTNRSFTIFGSPALSGIAGYDATFVPDAASGAPFAGETCAGKDLGTLSEDSIREKKRLDLSYLLEAYKSIRAAHPEMSFFGTADAAGHYWADYLFGTDEVRLMIESGATEEAIRASWEAELQDFLVLRAPYLLYP